MSGFRMVKTKWPAILKPDIFVGFSNGSRLYKMVDHSISDHKYVRISNVSGYRAFGYRTFTVLRFCSMVQLIA
jgi:hypothetical protein